MIFRSARVCFLLPPRASVSIDTRPCWIINLEFLATEGRDYRGKKMHIHTHSKRAGDTAIGEQSAHLRLHILIVFKAVTSTRASWSQWAFLHNLVLCFLQNNKGWLIGYKGQLGHKNIRFIRLFPSWDHKNSSGGLQGPRVTTQRHQCASRAHQ